MTAQKVYAMLDNENLWDVAVATSQALTGANVAHAVCGGVAVCLHGYQRNTVDLDLDALAEFLIGWRRFAAKGTRRYRDDS